MHKPTYQDQVIGLSHGDALVSIYNGKFLYRFRCGPVPRICRYGMAFYSKGHQGKVKHAWGQDRCRKTYRTVRLLSAHAQDGFKIRKGRKLLNYLNPKWADERPPCHAEKNWKRHRLTQYH